MKKQDGRSDNPLPSFNANQRETDPWPALGFVPALPHRLDTSIIDNRIIFGELCDYLRAGLGNTLMYFLPAEAVKLVNGYN